MLRLPSDDDEEEDGGTSASIAVEQDGVAETLTFVFPAVQPGPVANADQPGYGRFGLELSASDITKLQRQLDRVATRIGGD